MLAGRFLPSYIMGLFVLFSTIHPISLFGQRITNEYVDELKAYLNTPQPDTSSICKLLHYSFARNREYYIDVNPEESARIIVVYSVRERVAGRDAISYRFTRTEPTQLPVRLSIPLGPVQIDTLVFLVGDGVIVRKSFLDKWHAGKLMHITLTARDNIEIELIPCPAPQTGGFLDKPIIKIPPTRKKITLLTASFGAITGGTFFWFRNEKGNADDLYEQYRTTTTSKRVIELRTAVEKSRKQRNIAGAVSIASGAVFAVLLARDLFFRKQASATPYTYLVPTSSPEKRFSFELEPPVSAQGITLAMNIKF
jgi:hypothetical protein